ncbi:HAD family phosphatase [Lachnospiraceae bacterium 42-17]|nr:HAD family phosphatase [Dorea sp.]
MISALVFDMDGLLLDSERIVKRSWEEAGEVMGIARMGEHIYHTLGINRAGRDAYFRKALGEDFNIEEFSSLASRCFYQILDKEEMPLKPGAEELLIYARSFGYKTAVATSSSRDYSIRMLKSVGIYKYFDGGIFGDMVQHTKPDPEIYRKACEEIGMEPECCLALEDSSAGIRSAHAAGLKVIAVPDLLEPPKEVLSLAYRRCDSLHEVIPLLREGIPRNI